MLQLFLGSSFLVLALAVLFLTVTVSRIADRLLPVPAEVPEGIPIADIPLDITNLIDMESESWAQQDLEIEAARLYEIHKDWAIVHAQLLTQVGGPSPQEASDRAWEAEPEVVDMDQEPVAEGF